MKAVFQQTALPTVYLFLSAIGLTVGSVGLDSMVGSTGLCPNFWFYPEVWVSLIQLLITLFSLIGLTLSSYAMFTVTHDAIHGSLSSVKLVNDGIGLIANLWLGPVSNWYGLRTTHLQHHMHTNDPTLDPDFWVSRQGPGGPKYIYLRWATLDFYHLYEYLVRTGSGPRRSGSRRSFYLYEVGKIFLIGLSLTVIDLKTLLFYWVVPSRLCILLLAYLFDYLPHAPHQVAKRTDKYGTTAYLSVPEFLAPIAKYLLFYQNYHLIHHLFPRYPFYQMYRIWVEMKRDLLVEKSVPVTRVLHFLGKETLFEAPLDLTGLVRDLDLTGLVRDKQAEDFLSDVRTDLQREEPYLPFPKGLLTKEIGRAYDRVSRSYLDSQTRWITYFYQVRDALSKEA